MHTASAPGPFDCDLPRNKGERFLFGGRYTGLCCSCAREAGWEKDRFEMFACAGCKGEMVIDLTDD
jgi:hypothetical protein